MLAHIAVWTAHEVDRLAANDRGETLPQSNDLDQINAEVFAQHRDQAWEQVLQSLEQTYRLITDRVQAIPEADLQDPTRYTWTNGRPLYLRLAFTAEVTRTQRRSDGSFGLEGIRFEVPSRYAHFHKLTVRYASWDRSFVHLADPTTGVILGRLYPQDKSKNAEGRRAPRQPVLAATAPTPAGMAPLLQQILRQYAATGLPPAYLPQPDHPA